MEQTSAAATSTTLAALPGKGLIRTCHSGCVHVTYGCITLDFCRPEGFQRLAELVRRHPQEGQEGQVAQVQYGHATLRFSPEQFQEFAGLLAVGQEHLEQLGVVRRLLSGLSQD